MTRLLNKVRFWGLGLCLVLLLCISCTPQQRLNRLVDRHPELVRDSMVVLSLQQVLPGWCFDTLLPLIPGRQMPFKDESHGLSGLVLVSDSGVSVHIDMEPETVRFDTCLSFPVIDVKLVPKRHNGILWAVVMTLGFCLVFVILIRR